MTENTNDMKKVDLEELIAEKVADEVTPTLTKSTSALLTPDLKKLKNGVIVERIQIWLEHVDTLELIEKSHQHALIMLRSARDKEEWVSYQPIIFSSSVGFLWHERGSRQEMSQFKKTLTLPIQVYEQLTHAAVDLGVTLGEMIRIAASHTYLRQDETTGEYQITPEVGDPYPEVKGTGAVAEETQCRIKAFNQALKK